MKNPIESIKYGDHVIMKEYIASEDTYLISSGGRQMKVTSECLSDSVLDEQTLFEILLGINRRLKESINLDKPTIGDSIWRRKESEGVWFNNPELT